ncbi:endo-1,3-beta-glucanase [Xanthomonas oryzae pv. oryzae KACC 10331]|uniref:Endo-1,3-beta-glucanase n=1 Tax=Xanthomonas oryzae pv. oryzae (strain KACC10331 / KXO85) TaxID=291331 RepID=Q5H3A1_XANOR|nr:endo-1,3-beta-glucanase [Xanthomonas oryzae pv. oryzae KACC 10331]
MSLRSQFFHNLRFFCSQAKLRSTIQRLGMTLIANCTANRRIGAALHWDYNGSQADYDTNDTSAVNLHSRP